MFGEMFLVSSNLSGKVLQVVGAPAWTNPQKYRHVKDTCLILAHLYPLPAKLFYGITENKKSANEHLTQTTEKK